MAHKRNGTTVTDYIASIIKYKIYSILHPDLCPHIVLMNLFQVFQPTIYGHFHQFYSENSDSFFCMIIRCRFSTEGKNAEINRPVFTFYTIFMPLHMLEDDLFAKLSSFLTQRHFRFCQWFLVFGVEMSITLKNLLHLLMINKNSCHILIPSLCLKCAAKSLINRPSFP